MTHTMEVLDASGHLTLSWDPADQSSVDRAREEFDRMKAAGFAFFAAAGPEPVKVTRLKPAALAVPGSLEVRVVREFQPQARRTVAVRPMVGG